MVTQKLRLKKLSLKRSGHFTVHCHKIHGSILTVFYFWSSKVREEKRLKTEAEK